MTKLEQERCDAALSYLKDSKLDLPQVVKASSYFIAGAEWSDSTMIDKVEKYLRAKIILYTFATTVDQREEWFNNFKKAMEE